MTKKIIIFFMLSCTYLMAADVQLDEESTRKAKCTMGFVAVIGCTAFEWLSQLFVDRNPVVMGITAVNSMLSGDIEKLVGKAYQEKIDQALFVVGICQSPKVTIESYALNFVLSKLAGKQVSAAILGSIALGSLIKTHSPENLDQKDSMCGIMLAGASTLLPDLIEQLASKSYREKFTQALFVAGLCLAPEVTIGSYTFAFILDRLYGVCLEKSSIEKGIFGYFGTRIGGYFGRLAPAIIRNIRSFKF